MPLFASRSILRRLQECEDEEDPNYALGFGLTFVAGMATVLGCVAILCIQDKKNPKKITAGALAFAAGVMMYVSFIDVLGGEAPEFFEHHFHPEECGRRLTEGGSIADAVDGVSEAVSGAVAEGVSGVVDKVNQTLRPDAGVMEIEDAEEESIFIRICVAGFFFVGIVLATTLDKCVDAFFGESHSHGAGSDSDEEAEAPTRPISGKDVGKAEEKASLERISLVTFLALSMHNFPEGLATFFGGGTGSFTVPIAIALHNIPEGMAIAVPTYQATGSCKKAVFNTFIAGLAQPIGALVGWLLIAICGLEDLPAFIYGVVYAMTAGIMVCVSLMELLPEAFSSASPVFVIYCILAGFILMEFSIICLDLSGA